MVVGFEFLDQEPIKNVITNLNFKIDKTIYFGYAADISKCEETLTGFLSKYCGVSEVEFVKVPKGKLQETLEIMRSTVQKEKSAGNQIFFDITGGEALPLVAFGMISVETETPMHYYNIERSTLKELDEGASQDISKTIPRRIVPFTIEMLIELRGGAIKKSSTKSNKKLDDVNSLRESEKLIRIFDKHIGRWSNLTSAIRTSLRNDGDGVYHVDYNKVADHYYPKFVQQVKGFIKDCADERLIQMFTNDSGEGRFSFASSFVKKNLLEDGAVLELRTCLMLRKKYGDAQAGVHVDWNGVIDETVDVINEVDVISIDGYTPIIVSCKCGNSANMGALYELETVANRFGGKYARKILVSAKDMTETDKKRAKEMGIEVEILDGSVKVKNYDD